MIEKYDLNISVTRFLAAEKGTRNNKAGNKGSFRISVWSEEIQEYLYCSMIISPIVYVRNENDFLAEEYAEQYKDVLKNLELSGISMKIGNTPNELKNYIESLAPKNKNENISFEVEVFEKDGPILFRKAVAGTRNNKNGTNGSCPVKIIVKNSLCVDDVKEVREVIQILATPYEESSYDDSDDDDDDDDDYRPSYSSSSSSSRPSTTIVSTTPIETTGIKVSKTSTTSGIWEQIGDKWKLKLENGSYANTQWALIKDKWYLLGKDDYMLNGWQMVNDKWYLLAKDGDMLSGWQLVSGKWYYMVSSGEMVTGWKQIAGKWYYMDSTGVMMANTITPDGYRVNENGEWVQ